MAEDILRRLVNAERELADLRRSLDDWRHGFERRQSEIIGRLVEAKLWPVDESTGRSKRANADGHSDADDRGSEGGCPARNPKVRQDPPRWRGTRNVGRRFSECSAEYLRGLASFIRWCGDQDEAAGARTSTGKPRAPFLFADARLADDWATYNAGREER